jgi:hypothetical protein
MRYLNTVIYFALLSSALAHAHDAVLHYRPAEVEISGVLDLQTFPGLPNYKSIASGDEPERHFYLKLDVPVNVLPQRGDHIDNPEVEKNVKIVQLAINGEDEVLWSSFRKAGQGAHVTIIGNLFHRFTGHHHSRILLAVDKLKN